MSEEKKDVDRLLLDICAAIGESVWKSSRTLSKGIISLDLIDRSTVGRFGL
jgi:hypothetical protein